MMKMKMIWNKS